tara:strand:+ start:1480 stop:2712 length:1233 start_codon:yes stop_codon:yes gene_type:complete
MPKAVQEIKSFNIGVVTAADDNDIKINAAVYSEDIDPNGTEGSLQGRKKDRLIEIAHYRSQIDIIKPNPDDTSGGDIKREINIQRSDKNLFTSFDVDYPYEIKVNLTGTVPTQDVTVRFKIFEFSSPNPPRSSMLRIASALGGGMPPNPNQYPNSGEYMDIVFTPTDWTAERTFWLEVRDIALPNEIIHLDITATSSDTDWSVGELNSRIDFGYFGDSIFGIVIDQSEFLINNVLEGTFPFGGPPEYDAPHTGYKVGYKLSHNPYLFSDTGTCDLTISSANPIRLKVDRIGASSTELDTKTLSFTNANFDTFQYIYPYGVDDNENLGNRTVHLQHTFLSGNSSTYLDLEGNLAGKWRYDGATSHFGDGNDFPFANDVSFPVIILDNTAGNNDDGTSGGSGDADDGWIDKP